MQVFAKLLATKSSLPAEQKAIDEAIQKHLDDMGKEIKKIQIDFSQSPHKQTAEKFKDLIQEIIQFQGNNKTERGGTLYYEANDIPGISSQEKQHIQEIVGARLEFEFIKINTSYYDLPDWELKIKFV